MLPAFFSGAGRRGALLCVLLLTLVSWLPAVAQELSPAMLEEAARRSGMSQDEIMRRYQERQQGGAVDTTRAPGLTTAEGLDDRVVPARGEASYWQSPDVLLPLSEIPVTVAQAESLLAEVEQSPPVFGRDFFRLPAGVFDPPSFGPVPADYLVGVGDEIVVDVWGEVEFRLERAVDRDGSIILPRGGKVVCQNRTLEQVAQAVRQRLSQSYAGLDDGSIELQVSLGRLRAIRVFVIGDVAQPGAYELSSVSTVLTALYAAGGPGQAGSLRGIRLLRGGEQVGELDLYRYLLEGLRDGDQALREGDTILVPPRQRTVLLQGEVRRQAYFELLAGETLVDLLAYGGGFTAEAARRVVHVERIVPAAERRADLPDRTFLDLELDPATGRLLEPAAGELLDGDVVTVDAIQDRLGGWVQVKGHVKRPGRFEFTPGATLKGLIAQAGGTWPDVLLDVATVDRLDALERPTTVTVNLGEVLAGRAADLPLEERDVVTVFAQGEMRDRQTIDVRGEVRRPGEFTYREGMTLLDALVRAGGIPSSGNVNHVEIHRLQPERVFSAAAEPTSAEVVTTLSVDMGPDYLEHGCEFLLEPFDQIVVRRLPWYEEQRMVELRGEVFYNGAFALETTDERLSSVIRRAGGLKATAYAAGARVERNGLGNVAVDLEAALAEPGGPQDIILQAGDRVLVPERQYTVKVVGEVGFPTALVYEDGKKINWYVDRAGGYLEQADKGRTRVIHPNGLSQPNKGGHRVLPGSTIVVPVEPPPEGPTTLETLKEISAIIASVATVWLVIDRATE